MKRITIILTFLLSFIAGYAQQGLRMNDLFEGRIIPQERLIETRIRGKALSKYQLSYYRSLRFKASEKEVADLRRLMNEDGKGHFVTASDRAESKGTRAVQNYIYRIQLGPQDGKHRFLCYQDVFTSHKEPREVMVIYMEGSVADLSKLEELINNKK